MNVGVFSYYYLPIINGVTISIADWKRYLDCHGVNTTIYVPQLNTKPPPGVVYYPAIPLYRKFGITVPLFMVKPKSLDVIHVHHPYFIGNLALSVKRKFGIPLVFTYHTRYQDYLQTYVPIMSKWLVKILSTRMIVQFMNQCDAVTVANESLKIDLLRTGVQKPVYVVPPGIHTRVIKSGNREETRKRLDIGARSSVLLYVGRLAKEKNIYFLLRAFSILRRMEKDAVFLLCGNGLEETRLRAFVKKNKMERWIRFADHEMPDTIKDIYAAADYFVYASRTETYGRVVVEAMAAGLPIVALAAPSIIDLITDRITGRIVYRQTPREFSRILQEVIVDRSSAKKMGIDAQKEARQKYDSHVSGRLLIDVYKAVLDSK